MQRAICFALGLMLCIVWVVPSAIAAPPQPVEFVLMATSGDAGEIEMKENRVKIQNLTAAGTVSGDFDGTFTYTERIGASPDKNRAQTQGEVTILTGEGEIHLKFVGVVQLLFPEGSPNPMIITVDQPWTITGGTGTFDKITGTGRRSTFTDGCGGEFCVRYTGKVMY